MSISLVYEQNKYLHTSYIITSDKESLVQNQKRIDSFATCEKVEPTDIAHSIRTYACALSMDASSCPLSTLKSLIVLSFDTVYRPVEDT
jgi:hypothetical protein